MAWPWGPVRVGACAHFVGDGDPVCVQETSVRRLARTVRLELARGDVARFPECRFATLPVGPGPDPGGDVCVLLPLRRRFLGLSPSTSSTAELRSGFSSLSYSDCCLYFSKEKMLCEGGRRPSPSEQGGARVSMLPAPREDEGEGEPSGGGREGGGDPGGRPSAEREGPPRVREQVEPAGTAPKQGPQMRFLLLLIMGSPFQLLGDGRRAQSWLPCCLLMVRVVSGLSSSFLCGESGVLSLVDHQARVDGVSTRGQAGLWAPG